MSVSVRVCLCVDVRVSVWMIVRARVCVCEDVRVCASGRVGLRVCLCKTILMPLESCLNGMAMVAFLLIFLVKFEYLIANTLP